MKRRIGALLIVMMLMMVTLSGCQNESGAGNQDIKIFYAAVENVDYYQNLVNLVSEKAAESGVQVYAEYADNSIEAQDEHVKKAVAEGYDVIMCSLVTPDTATELKAIAGDIPIVFVNSAPDDEILGDGKYVYVASNEAVAGQYQAEYVLEKLADKEELNVVVFKGPKGHSATLGRTSGAKKTLEASGKKINYVFEDYADFNAAKAQELMEVFLKTDVPIDCVICNNDEMALGAIAACENANVDTSSILFLGIDASANGCVAIKDGRMAFSAYQNGKAQCEAATEVAIKLANGESVQGIEGATEDGKYVWIPFEKVDSSNVAQYSAE
ncbi:MAG: substrate-binding domain-containing protein [Lachnospiraceae bacterium]|nr:substrate-binding domain-containing protein [Lachnospiraceae bacterium]